MLVSKPDLDYVANSWRGSNDVHIFLHPLLPLSDPCSKPKLNLHAAMNDPLNCYTMGNDHLRFVSRAQLHINLNSKPNYLTVSNNDQHTYLLISKLHTHMRYGASIKSHGTSITHSHTQKPPLHARTYTRKKGNLTPSTNMSNLDFSQIYLIKVLVTSFMSRLSQGRRRIHVQQDTHTLIVRHERGKYKQWCTRFMVY